MGVNHYVLSVAFPLRKTSVPRKEPNPISMGVLVYLLPRLFHSTEELQQIYPSEDCSMYIYP